MGHLSIDRQKVIDQFDYYSQSPAYIHWKIYYGDKALPSNVVSSTEPIQDLSRDSSRQALVRQLMSLTDGLYLIQFKPSEKANNNLFSLRFELMPQLAIYQGIGAGQMGAGTGETGLPGETIKDLIKAHVDGALSSYKQELQEQKLREQEEELKKLRAQVGSGSTLQQIKEIMNGAASIYLGMKNAGSTGPEVRVAKATMPAAGNDEDAFYHKLYEREWDRFCAMAGGDKEAIGLLFCMNEYIQENEAVYNNMLYPELIKYFDRLKTLQL